MTGLRSKMVSMVLLACVGAPALAANHTGRETLSLDEVWTIIRGGQMYDNWYTVLGQPAPERSHPSYPKGTSKSGGVTWRCKQCHGWDYKGKDGAYAKGSNFTGIAGIRAAAGRPISQIERVLRDGTHRYTREQIPDDSLRLIATFVSRGQIDMDRYINPETGEVAGDAARGKRMFGQVCAKCHGVDGKNFNFKSMQAPEFIGTYARVNPWEVFHKAIFGQPGAGMVSMGELMERYMSGELLLNPQDVADLTRYAQTELPEK